MGFFDDLAIAPELGDDGHSISPAWAGPPPNEVPGSVPGTHLVARGGGAGIVVDGIRAYSTGWSLTLTLMHRSPIGPFDLVVPFGPVIPSEHLPAGMTTEMFEGRMRFGLGFADGSRVRSDMMYGVFSRKGKPDGPVLWPCGGGGGAQSWGSTLWCWPLPPEGPIRMVAQWPAMGIEERSLEIDSAEIREASQRAVQLWPDSGELRRPRYATLGRGLTG
jgi:hypothetical protein